MLLSGFTFIRNSIRYDFPIVECIESMLPLVDELVVNIGKSDDATEETIQKVASTHGSKIRIIHSIWDERKTDRGLVLSEQTNIALKACNGRWALYLQADEALHEDEHAYIRSSIEAEDVLANPAEAFSFRYLHFYGGYSMVQRAHQWYPSEIRIVRKNSGAFSFGDAQTFRKKIGTEEAALSVKTLNAHVYHYGHAREPEKMLQKINYFHRFWHGDEHGIKTERAYKKNVKELIWYWGTHPAPYKSRVEKGKRWSTKPQDIVSDEIKEVVILTSGAEWELALTLKKYLNDRFTEKKIDVSLCDNYLSWSKEVLSGLFKRKSRALVDLRSEPRSLFFFLGFVVDALSSFKYRIAHAHKGQLSKFRRFFYTFIHWVNHEDREKPGLLVPEEKYSVQISRWLGLEP